MKGLYDVWKWRLIQGTGQNVEPTHVQRDVESAAPSLTKSSIKSVFVSILLFHGNVIEILLYLDRGTWHGMIWMVTLSTHVRFSWPRQLTTLTIRPRADPMHHVDGLAQDCSDSSALAMELLQSYAKPSMSIDAKWRSRVRKMIRRKTHFLWNYGDKYEKTLLDLRLVHLCMDLQKWLS